VRIGGTDVMAAVRLEVEDVATGGGVDDGRVSCAVTCSPAAYPHLLSSQQEDLQAEYRDLLQSILGHESLLPSDLCILHGKKSWLLNLDAVVLSDTGNIYDVMFTACRAALYDTRIPKTRAVAYQSAKMSNPTNVEMEDNFKAALRTRKQSRAADFELEDAWNEGDALVDRNKWPICITLNVLPSVHVVDATPGEEQAIPLKLLLFFAFSNADRPILQGTRMIGPGQVSLPHLKRLMNEAEGYASQLVSALNNQLKDVSKEVLIA